MGMWRVPDPDPLPDETNDVILDARVASFATKATNEDADADAKINIIGKVFILIFPYFLSNSYIIFKSRKVKKNFTFCLKSQIWNF